MFPTTPLGATLLASGPLIPAQPGFRIRVHAVVAVSATQISAKFQSATTDISGNFPMAQNGGFTLPFSEAPWMQTARGEALNVAMSSSTQVAYQIVYSLTAG
jgi:hypothetical protein